MKNFSLSRAFGLSAAGIAVAAAASGVYAVWHHASGHFETLGDAFAYAAQPANVALAAGLSLVFGFGMELMRHYHKTLDAERGALRRPATPPHRPR